MIIRFLRAIRQKPKGVRDQYAFWIATSCTALVAFLWVWQLPGQTELSSIAGPDNTASIGAFSSFIDGARDSLPDLAPEEVETDAATSPQTTEASSEIIIDQAFIDQQAPNLTSSSLTPAPAERAVRIATTSAPTTP